MNLSYGGNHGVGPCPACGYHGVLIRVSSVGDSAVVDLRCGGDCSYIGGTFKGATAYLSVLAALADWNNEIEG